MKNPLPNQVPQKESESNLSAEAKQLLEVLDELQDFTTKLRKKLMAELKPENTEEEKF